MTTVCFYFELHLPERVKNYRVFDIGNDSAYFGATGIHGLNNSYMLRKILDTSYIPMAHLLKGLLTTHRDLKIGLSFSGVFLDLLEREDPKTLSIFKDIVETRRAEILGETYYNSLSFLYSQKDFGSQVKMHKRKVEKLFDVTPVVFRNTELMYSPESAIWADKQGYRGIVAEGVPSSKTFGKLLKPQGARSIKVLQRHTQLSDDMLHRYKDIAGSTPLQKAQTYADSLEKYAGSDTLNIFVPMDVFGDVHSKDDGIFIFFSELIRILEEKSLRTALPKETLLLYPAEETLDTRRVVSWIGHSYDLSHWLGNDMQHEAIETLYKLEYPVLESKNARIIDDWRKLQSADHFFSMSTLPHTHARMNRYKNHYGSPYDAFISYMNVLKDLRARVRDTARTHDDSDNEFVTVFA